MTPAQKAAATRYARNCVELNPDASAYLRAREYCDDEGIAASEQELSDIAFDALFGPGSLGELAKKMKEERHDY